MAKASESSDRSGKIIVALIAAVATLIAALATIIAALIGIIPEFWKPLPAEINITAHVSNSDLGTSIRGAKITLLLEGISIVEYSDSDGNQTFRVDAARKGVARLFVEASGYEIYDTSIGLAKDRFVDVRLVSGDSNNRTIIIRAVDSMSSNPVEGARVVFLANGDTFSQTTDSNGIATFTVDFTGETLDADISVSTSAYEINRQRVTVRPDQVQDMRLDNVSNEIALAPIASSGNLSDNISYDQIMPGSISQAAQKDRYTFTGNPGDVILITLARVEGDLWPEIRLYSPGGDEINTARSPGASVELRETLPSAGEYIILVGDGSGGTRTGQYHLNLQKIAP